MPLEATKQAQMAPAKRPAVKILGQLNPLLNPFEVRIFLFHLKSYKNSPKPFNSGVFLGLLSRFELETSSLPKPKDLFFLVVC